MRNDRIIPGLILVMIGVLILLSNFGHVHFHLWNIFRLWPIFLVIGGINLLLAHNRSPLATLLKVAVVIGGFALIAFGNFDDGYHWWPGFRFSYHNDRDDDDDETDSTKNGKVLHVRTDNTFIEAYAPTITHARLNISGGATIYNLNDTTNELFKAHTVQSFGHYTFNHHMDDSVMVLDFDMKNHNRQFSWHDNSDGNKVDIRLNVNPVWDINIEAGATKLDFDLLKYKIQTLDISGGAADFNVKLGQPLAETNVSVSSGMASVTIKIPANAACHISTSTGLAGNHFEGFNKNADNTYDTPGFANAKNKINIELSGGMADFKVERY
jgi:hypothetical protein